MRRNFFLHLRLINLFLTVIFLTIFYVSPCQALLGGKVESFSAESVALSSDGKVTHTSKIFFTPEAVRMDGVPGMGGAGTPEMNLSILILKKQDKQYIYNHDKKLVYESPVDENNMKNMMKEIQNIQSEKVMGKEKVSGYKCVKKEVVTSMDIMGMTVKNTSIVWQSDRFDLPLKSMDEDGNIQELRNIDTKKPSSKVFEPLTGYTKVSNMMKVMGMDLGSMMSGEQEAPDMKNVDPETIMKMLEQSMGGQGKP